MSDDTLDLAFDLEEKRRALDIREAAAERRAHELEQREGACKDQSNEVARLNGVVEGNRKTYESIESALQDALRTLEHRLADGERSFKAEAERNHILLRQIEAISQSLGTSTVEVASLRKAVRDLTQRASDLTREKTVALNEVGNYRTQVMSLRAEVEQWKDKYHALSIRAAQGGIR